MKILNFIFRAITSVFVAFTMLCSFQVKGQSAGSFITLNTAQKNQLHIQQQNDEYKIETTGNDSWIMTEPLKSPIGKDDVMLSFEYFSLEGLDLLQIYFGPKIKEAHSKIIRKVALAEGWIKFSVDLSDDIKDWGQAGDILRLDFGTIPNAQIQIRNIQLRTFTEREMQIAAGRTEKKIKEQKIEGNLNAYLSNHFPSQILNVSVSEDKIMVKGNTKSISNVYLCDITPYQDVTEATDFDDPVVVNKDSFELILPRFVKKGGLNYDRVLSKWVLAQKLKEGYQLVSSAHYPDQIYSKNNLTKDVAKGRKGLGDFGFKRGYVSDLDDLSITSVTVNIGFGKFMFSKPGPQRIAHQYNGKFYYFREKEVAQLDSTFLMTSRKGIITAAILLINNAEQCPDTLIGRLLQHPDMDPAGIYSMPNMTNPASVDCYAAALDFLAERYSRSDRKYGRLNHWIMHNEVDAGWEWTNMGEKSAPIFMDTYIKSMRMCYAIARTYNPFSEVFISLTHHWSWTSNQHFYPSKDLMQILLQFTKVEGDFQWAMAHHPYPQSLLEPKTWLDKQVDFTFNTPLITFSNLEVLNAWIKLPEALYQGKIKRTLWLSENGTNSKSYSDQDLAEQAAGFAYTWKKIEQLDGIDGFQWHNWFDHRNEGGLRIGLRRFPDDETSPGGTKPVWHLFKAADTKNENEFFDPYKKIIGIDNWRQVHHLGPIQ